MSAPATVAVPVTGTDEEYLDAALTWLQARVQHRPADDARRRLTEIAEAEPAPSLATLARRLGLSSFEADVLLLCVAAELDPELAGLCERANGLPYPTFALAMEVFDEPTWEPLLGERPLRRLSLVEVHQPPATALTASALRADERVVAYAKGVRGLDDRLSPLLHHLSPAGPGASLGSADRLVDRITEQARRSEEAPLVQLVGVDRPTKRVLAAAVAERLGLALYRLPFDLLPTDPAECERLARLWSRERLLGPVAIYLDDGDASDLDPRTASLRRLAARLDGLVVVDTRDGEVAERDPTIVAEIGWPSTTEQESAWQAALAPTDGEPRPPGDAAALANQFNLGIPTIHRLARQARVAQEDVWSLCLRETRRGLDGLAQRIDARAEWDQLVLPPAQAELVNRICGQVEHRRLVHETWGFEERTARGLGINALFAGPSGTGKTMAAEVIARRLGLNLYRIDLSAVVSKYIGETEKNLARLFDAAEQRGVVLHFDECDSLFGKRTEVRDSHDRYANIESSYLLQRLESFQGLAILATNMKSALDQGFVRRLRFVVDFPYPGVPERTRIWEHIFPPDARTEGLDAARLGRLNLTGGNIFTVAMNAAFLAAEQGEPVRMEHILEAARTETRKLERPVNETDFHLPEAVAR